jgi:hypothetical protein
MPSAQRVTEDKRRPSGGASGAYQRHHLRASRGPSIGLDIGRSAGAGNSFYPAMPPIAWIHPLAVWTSAVTPETINPRLHATTQPPIKLRNWPRPPMSWCTQSSIPPWLPTRPASSPSVLSSEHGGDLGAMARRAGVKHLMLTHMIPPLGVDQLGRYKLPAVLTEADYRNFGFQGSIVVGTDLASVRLPSNRRNSPAISLLGDRI